MNPIRKLMGEGREGPPLPAVALAVLAVAVAGYSYATSPYQVSIPITIMAVIAALQVTRSRPGPVKLRPVLLTFGSLMALSLCWVLLRRWVDASDTGIPIDSFWLAMTVTIGLLLYGSYRVSEVFWFRHPKVAGWRRKSRRGFIGAVVFHACYSSFQIVTPSAIIAFRAGPLVVSENQGWLIVGAALASTLCGTTLALEKLRPSRLAQARAAEKDLLTSENAETAPPILA